MSFSVAISTDMIYEAPIFGAFSFCIGNPPPLRGTSPVYGICFLNRRFGQNLTLGKGGYMLRPQPK